MEQLASLQGHLGVAGISDSGLIDPAEAGRRAPLRGGLLLPLLSLPSFWIFAEAGLSRPGADRSFAGDRIFGYPVE